MTTRTLTAAATRPLTSRSLTVLALATLSLGALIAPQRALAAPADMTGTWVNSNVTTSGITRVNVTRSAGGQMTVQVFGRCHPNDCDWGSAPLITYGTTVSDGNHFTATAVYAKVFATTTLVMNFTKGRLDVQALTQFTDGSGRQNYASRDAFARYR
ncbi:hypothetical protein [Deinococcus sp. RM]|uniref:hypothetical protein n=1 Tax=Deinococcus sp. RM TaxID=2316359 RepID=UPI000E69E36D|nr:hypothetical protein [Deinococcus sp. RM]RIX98409.1 hypothetical protein D3W47_17805 [Deinococcus sp. RM]